MKIKLHGLKRTAYLVVAFGLAMVGLVQGVMTGQAHAFPVGGQVQQRSIRMSSSTPGATSVTYLVSFRPATAHTITGIVLDFCDSSSTPIIGDATCTLPTGFSVGTPTISAAPNDPVFTNLGGSWTPVSANSARTLKMTSSGVAVNTSTTYAFNISTITNQNATGTFYARFITYVGGTGGGTDYANYAPGTEGNTSATDYGGFALSTANAISITAKVQESMTFCVSEADPTTNCGGVTPPSLELGHGANTILDASAVDTAQAYTQLSTNAQGGAVMRIKNSAASGGLNSGSNSIPPAGATAATFVAGTANFGLFVANGTGGTGTITASAPYNSSGQYGMDATTSGENVLSTYGDPIASAAAPVNNVENTLTFAATASNTTPAGLYSATITIMVAGTF